MKIAFYILTLIVCGVAAYYSLSHKEMFESQQTTRLETIEANKNVSARADVTEADITRQDAVLDQAKLERNTAAAALESLTATGRTLTNQISEIESTIETQEDEIVRLNKAIDDVMKMLEEFGDDVTPGSISDTIASLEAQRDELMVKRDELDELAAAAERNLAQKQTEAARIAQRAATRNSQLALNATEAVISAVNHDWGFVLIGAGSNSGFTPQSSMVVQRDGRVIGRIRPSSVEPTQTVAEIEYSTMAAGVRIQPGDRVLLASPVAN